MEIKIVVNRRDENKFEKLYGLAMNPFSARARAETDVHDYRNTAIAQLKNGAGSEIALTMLLGKIGLSAEAVHLIRTHCTEGKVYEVIVRDVPKYEMLIGEVGQKGGQE